MGFWGSVGPSGSRALTWERGTRETNKSIRLKCFGMRGLVFWTWSGWVRDSDTSKAHVILGAQHILWTATGFFLSSFGSQIHFLKKISQSIYWLKIDCMLNKQVISSPTMTMLTMYTLKSCLKPFLEENMEWIYISKWKESKLILPQRSPTKSNIIEKWTQRESFLIYIHWDHKCFKK